MTLKSQQLRVNYVPIRLRIFELTKRSWMHQLDITSTVKLDTDIQSEV